MNATIEKALGRIELAASEHTDAERFIKSMGVDDWIRQGDVIVVRLADDIVGDAFAAWEGRQVAIGTTKGSRHVVGDGPELRLPAGVKGVPRALLGPTVFAPERWMLKHPEHCDFSLPSGVFGIVYERDYEQEEIQRVAD